MSLDTEKIIYLNPNYSYTAFGQTFTHAMLTGNLLPQFTNPSLNPQWPEFNNWKNTNGSSGTEPPQIPSNFLNGVESNKIIYLNPNYSYTAFGQTFTHAMLTGNLLPQFTNPSLNPQWPEFNNWKNTNGTSGTEPPQIIQPPTDPTPQLRTLPVPNDLSNSIIFSTNFYSRTDLSNGIGSVPSNLFDSCGNTDLSNNKAREFWLGEIKKRTFSDPSDAGITIITIQNPDQIDIGAHTLQFLNWDLSANEIYRNTKTYNNILFKGNNDEKLVTDLSLICGIPNLQSPYDISVVDIPIALESDTNGNTYFDSTYNASDSFINYMIVLGAPILVNISNAYRKNLISINNNKLNWRSFGNNVSSANNIWIDISIENNKQYTYAYADKLLTLKLDEEIILIPEISYNINYDTGYSMVVPMFNNQTFHDKLITSVNSLTIISNPYII